MILIVEDNQDWGEILKLHLKVGGYDSVTVRSLAQALAAMESNRFDLVLLDLYLDDSRGAATAQRILLADPTVPIVVATGMDPDFVNVKLPVEVMAILDKMKTSPEGYIKAVSLAIQQGKAKQIRQDVQDRQADVVQAMSDTGNAIKEIQRTLEEARPS